MYRNGLCFLEIANHLGKYEPSYPCIKVHMVHGLVIMGGEWLSYGCEFAGHCGFSK